MGQICVTTLNLCFSDCRIIPVSEPKGKGREHPIGLSHFKDQPAVFQAFFRTNQCDNITNPKPGIAM